VHTQLLFDEVREHVLVVLLVFEQEQRDVHQILESLAQVGLLHRHVHAQDHVTFEAAQSDVEFSQQTAHVDLLRAVQQVLEARVVQLERELHYLLENVFDFLDFGRNLREEVDALDQEFLLEVVLVEQLLELGVEHLELEHQHGFALRVTRELVEERVDQLVD